MRNLKIVTVAVFAALAIMFGLSACETEADTVDRNLSKDAETFKVQRKIVFINGITD